MRNNKEKMSKLELKGWVDDYESRWKIPSKCPKCGSDLSRTDAIGLIGIMFIYCKNYKCRWCSIFEE